MLLGVLTAFAPLSIDMYLPALPALETYFKATEGAVQLTLAMFIVGFSLGQTLYGPLTDRFGRKPPLYIGMVVYTISSGACALAASVGALTALRLLQSLGACAGSVISRAMVRDLFPPEETRRVYSALILVMGVSPLLAPLFGAYMLLWLGWQAIFLSVMIVGALATIAMFFRLPETLPAAQPLSFGHVFATYGALLKDRFFLGATLATGFSSAGMFAYIAGAPFVFINLYGVRPDHFSWFFGLNAAAVVIGAQVNGRVLHGHDPEKVMRYAAMVQAAAGLLLMAAWARGRKVAGKHCGAPVHLHVYHWLRLSQRGCLSAGESWEDRGDGVSATGHASVQHGRCGDAGSRRHQQHHGVSHVRDDLLLRGYGRGDAPCC